MADHSFPLNDADVAAALEQLAEHGQSLLAASTCTLLRDAGRRLRRVNVLVSVADPVPLLLTVKQAAECAGLSRSTVYVLIVSKEWPSIRIGRSVRIPHAGLVAWINEQQKREMGK